MNNDSGRFPSDRFDSIPSSPVPPVREKEEDPWGVLIAISEKAKTRPQVRKTPFHIMKPIYFSVCIVELYESWSMYTHTFDAHVLARLSEWKLHMAKRL